MSPPSRDPQPTRATCSLVHIILVHDGTGHVSHALVCSCRLCRSPETHQLFFTFALSCDYSIGQLQPQRAQHDLDWSGSQVTREQSARNDVALNCLLCTDGHMSIAVIWMEWQQQCTATDQDCRASCSETRPSLPAQIKICRNCLLTKWTPVKILMYKIV